MTRNQYMHTTNNRDDYFLDAEGNKKLFKVYQETQDPNLREELTLRNMGLVWREVKPYKKIGIKDEDLEDLVSEGTLALVKSVKGYDLERGFTFASYASHNIRKAIRHALGTIKIAIKPSTRNESWNKFVEEGVPYIEQCQREGEEPDIQMLAEMCGTKPREINLFIRAYQSRMVPDTSGEDKEEKRRGIPIYDLSSKDKEIYEIVGDEEEIRIINELINSDLLNERERQIMKLYLYPYNGKVATLEEIGEKYGISGERTRQVTEIAKRKIISRLCNEEDQDLEKIISVLKETSPKIMASKVGCTTSAIHSLRAGIKADRKINWNSGIAKKVADYVTSQ